MSAPPVRESDDGSVAGASADASNLESTPTADLVDSPPVVSPEDVGRATAASFRERAGQGAIGASMLVVNGDVITIEDILDPLKAELERKASSLPAEEYVREVRRLVSTQIWQQINERLVYQEAIKKLDDRMSEILDAGADRYLKERINAEFDGRQSRFEKHLAELGRSLEDVHEQAKRHLLVSDYLRRKFIDQVPEPARPELWRYYQAHLDDFTEPAGAELFLIDIPFDAFLNNRDSAPASTDWLKSKERARRQAEAALAELDSGLPFDAVARTYSKGIHARSGGAWGAIGSSGLVGRYRAVTQALAGMGSREHSRVLEGHDAYFVVGTGEVKPARVLSFERAQPQIKEALRRKQLAELEREYLATLREGANVQRWQEFQVEVVRAVPRPKMPPSPRPSETADSRR